LVLFAGVALIGYDPARGITRRRVQLAESTVQ